MTSADMSGKSVKSVADDAAAAQKNRRKRKAKHTDGAPLEVELGRVKENAALLNLLPKPIIDVFNKSFKEFTDVQIRSANALLAYNDVVVESPTGSGKTLAFLLPALAIMHKSKTKWSSHEPGLLVLSPTRELAVQIEGVAKPYLEALNLRPVTLIGGRKTEIDMDILKKEGANVIFATPGRLEQLIELDKIGQLKRMLKNVEVLIVDEADRFTESAFGNSLQTIVNALPKQRRTGLFSATQAKEVSELVVFGLRNAKRISLKEAVREALKEEEKEENAEKNEKADKEKLVALVQPSALTNHYVIVDADEKLCALVEFIRSKPESKVGECSRMFLVFFSSCRCVAYFYKVLQRVLTKRHLFEVHGKNKGSRHTTIEKFAKTPASVMFSTDVMSRGIHVDDIDWVVQFDVPKQSSWFVHRSGRTGRCGKEGHALLILTPQQSAYVQFVSQYEKVELKEMKLKIVTPLKAEELRQKIVKMACADREILEMGSRAFVSFIEAYAKHDCRVVCKLQELDVVGHAHAYGLLRMPKMKELRKRDLDGFKRADVDTSTIKFQNKERESHRLEKLAKKKAEEEEKKKERLAKKRKAEEELDDENEDKTLHPKQEKKKQKREKKEKQREQEDEMDDLKLIKKMKKGRLGKSEIRAIKF